MQRILIVRTRNVELHSTYRRMNPIQAQQVKI